MFKKRLLFIGLLLMSFQCDEDNDDNILYPLCLQEQIEDVLSREATSPPATVKKYVFNGEEVFLLSFQNGFADGISVVVNDNCEEICLIGGIAGLICEGFDQAEFIETVWEDPR